MKDASFDNSREFYNMDFSAKYRNCLLVVNKYVKRIINMLMTTHFSQEVVEQLVDGTEPRLQTRYDMVTVHLLVSVGFDSGQVYKGVHYWYRYVQI